MNRELGFMKEENMREFKYTSISDTDGITSNIWNETKKSIQKHDKQLSAINECFSLFTKFSDYRNDALQLIEELKIKDSQINIEKRLCIKLGDACLAFLDFVTTIQRFTDEDKKDKEKEKEKEKVLSIPDFHEKVQSSQFDKYDEYKIAYQLGNFDKHYSHYIPIVFNYDNSSSNFYIDKTELLNLKGKFDFKKTEPALKKPSKIEISNFLTIIYYCIYIQLIKFVKSIFFNNDLKSIFKEDIPFIYKHGVHCVRFYPLDAKKPKLKTYYSDLRHNVDFFVQEMNKLFKSSIIGEV